MFKVEKIMLFVLFYNIVKIFGIIEWIDHMTLVDFEVTKCAFSFK